jgi:membrane protein insertase Oxa1/YidC/SpoIIIJ
MESVLKIMDVKNTCNSNRYWSTKVSRAAVKMECSIYAKNDHILVDVEMFLVQAKYFMQTMHFQDRIVDQTTITFFLFLFLLRFNFIFAGNFFFASILQLKFAIKIFIYGTDHKNFTSVC